MRKIAALLFACMAVTAAQAQLNGDETINYTLSLGFINAGKASLVTEKTMYNGTEAYSVSLTAATNKVADKIYRIRDTLTATISPQEEPLHFWKHSYEGDDIVRETAEFSKSGGKYHGILEKHYKDGTTRACDTICEMPVYDMVSITIFARHLDITGRKPGDRFHFELADAGMVEKETLIYLGRQKVKISGTQYNCLAFSVAQPSDNGDSSSDNELLKIYVSDDEQRIPVGLDIGLPFGKAKARIANR